MARLMTTAVLALLCACGGAQRPLVPPPPPPPQPSAPPPAAPITAAPARGERAIERWAESHPEASKQLGDWVHNYPGAASQMFQWDGHHTDRANQFVKWVVRHPNENVDAFISHHLDWEELNRILVRYRPAAERFMAWCRRHPEAADELMDHPRGLEWAGHHLYQDYWKMEHP